MKKLSNNISGFSVVEAMLILVIVGLIGFVGWWVFKSKQATNRTLSATAQGAGETQKTNKVSSGSSTSKSQQYLDIKEWGVQLPLSTQIADAYYVISTDSQDTSSNANTMWLGLKLLDSRGCAAVQANTSGVYPIGALLRVTPDATDPVSGTPYKVLDPDGTTIDSTYYAYHSGINGKTCASATKLQAIDKAFKVAARNIVMDEARKNCSDTKNGEVVIGSCCQRYSIGVCPL